MLRLDTDHEHLSRAIDRGDDEPNLDVEKLDPNQGDGDVARHHDSLVEHALEDIGEPVASSGLVNRKTHRPLPLVRPQTFRRSYRVGNDACVRS